MRLRDLAFTRIAPTYLGACGILIGAIVGACASQADDSYTRTPGANSGDGGEDEGPLPGGDLPDEQFPAALLEPYSGPNLDEYDDTNLSYLQVRARIDRVFADTGLGGGEDKFWTDKLNLLGGADFVTRFDEARVASPDYLLAMDGVAKEACTRASQGKTGPFLGSNPDAAGNESTLVTQLYQRILFRAPLPDELAATTALLASLIPLATNRTDAWGGVCEALVRHPDFLFTLPPSVNTTTGADQEKMQLVKVANDLVGRPPTDDEFAQLAGKTAAEKLDHYLATPDFQTFFFHRTRLRTETTGTAEGDEPARLWTYLAVNGAPMQELLNGDYSIDANFNKVPRGAEHGKSGILTMPGFVKTKPGLPHFNYAARVMSDYMGQIFEVTPEIVASRLPAQSTVDPTSTCIACHGVLTPLEHQRLAWADDGTFRTTDPAGKPIDDTDQSLVADYTYKGKGMDGFSTLAVRKEKFFRQSFQALFLFYMGRQMRYDQDERVVYQQLWRNAFKANGDIRQQIKIIAAMPTYMGQ